MTPQTQAVPATERAAQHCLSDRTQRVLRAAVDGESANAGTSERGPEVQGEVVEKDHARAPGRERLSRSAAASHPCSPGRRQQRPPARPAAHPQEASVRPAPSPALQEPPLPIPSDSSPDGDGSEGQGVLTTLPLCSQRMGASHTQTHRPPAVAS